MIANSDTPRNARRRLRRKIAECREAVAWLRDEAGCDPSRADELLALAAETKQMANEAEHLLDDRERGS
ncbi:MAG: hypothetical protein HQ582_06710 [Planctomycetes bacterium]|nr:hypothetical protein [Planctomycetota bacterium]